MTDDARFRHLDEARRCSSVITRIDALEIHAVYHLVDRKFRGVQAEQFLALTYCPRAAGQRASDADIEPVSNTPPRYTHAVARTDVSSDSITLRELGRCPRMRLDNVLAELTRNRPVDRVTTSMRS